MFNLFIIAGMIVAFGIYRLISRIKHIRNGIITEAIVIDRHFVKAADNEDHDEFNVTFKFHTLKNGEITFTWDLGSGCELKIGDKKTIAYQKDAPQDVVSLDYSGSFGEVIFLFSVALILIIIGAGYYWCEHYFETLIAVH